MLAAVVIVLFPVNKKKKKKSVKNRNISEMMMIRQVLQRVTCLEKLQSVRNSISNAADNTAANDVAIVVVCCSQPLKPSKKKKF